MPTRLVSAIACLLIACGQGEGSVENPSNSDEEVESSLSADCSSLSFFTRPKSNRRVAVDFQASRGRLKNLTGFLNGMSVSPNDTASFAAGVVDPLKPQFWRIGNGARVAYNKIRAFSPKVTLVLSDLYADSDASASPWKDWNKYELWLKNTLSATSDMRIAYYEVWGEPQGGTPFRGTYEQLLELYRRTYTVVKREVPGAKVVGPSFDSFTGRFAGRTAGQVIIDLDQKFHIRFEGLSWHELGEQPPSAIPNHVGALREFLSQQFPNYHPELHINEYMSPRDHHLPGSTLAYLQAMHESNVDVASRACWPQTAFLLTRWSDCWAGLNGLLLKDNKTPQSAYWVYRFYAGMVDQPRLTTSSTESTTIGLATKMAEDKGLTVLIGRTPSTPRVSRAPVTLSVSHLPGKKARVTVTTIPANSPSKAQPTSGSVVQCVAPVIGGTLTLTAASVTDGSAQRWAITTLP